MRTYTTRKKIAVPIEISGIFIKLKPQLVTFLRFIKLLVFPKTVSRINHHSPLSRTSTMILNQKIPVNLSLLVFFSTIKKCQKEVLSFFTIIFFGFHKLFLLKGAVSPTKISEIKKYVFFIFWRGGTSANRITFPFFSELPRSWAVRFTEFCAKYIMQPTHLPPCGALLSCDAVVISAGDCSRDEVGISDTVTKNCSGAPNRKTLSRTPRLSTRALMKRFLSSSWSDFSNMGSIANATL